jgi:ABC-type transporter MlaC component
MSRFKLLFILFMIFLFSCRTENETDCLSYVSSPVTQVSMLDSAILNQPINIDFYFNANNGCGNFYNFNVNTISDTMVISPVVKYEGCVCTMIFKIYNLPIHIRHLI